MAFQHTHHPQFSGQQFTNSSVRLTFGDALNELDWGVGQILQVLREANVEDNTFVFFTADNGYEWAIERWTRGLKLSSFSFWGQLVLILFNIRKKTTSLQRTNLYWTE